MKKYERTPEDIESDKLMEDYEFPSPHAMACMRALRDKVINLSPTLLKKAGSFPEYVKKGSHKVLPKIQQHWKTLTLSLVVGTAGYAAARTIPKMKFSHKQTTKNVAVAPMEKKEVLEGVLKIHVPFWKLEKIVGMLCTDTSDETVSFIKKHNKITKIIPGNDISVPFSLLKPEFRSPQLSTFTVPAGSDVAQAITEKLKDRDLSPEVAIFFSDTKPGRDHAVLDGLSSTITLPTSLIK